MSRHRLTILVLRLSLSFSVFFSQLTVYEALSLGFQSAVGFFHDTVDQNLHLFHRKGHRHIGETLFDG